MPPLADPAKRQHRIHRRGYIPVMLNRDEDYLRTGITEADTRIIYRATMLAPDLETAEALLRGETVPKNRLHHLWSRAFGRKHP